MVKDFLALVSMLVLTLGLLSCGFTGLAPATGLGGTMGSTGNLTIHVNGGSKDAIGVGEFPVIGTFSVTNLSQGLLFTTNWNSNWTGQFVYSGLQFGEVALLLSSIDERTNFNAEFQYLTIREGFNYEVWVSVGGNVYTWVVSSNM